ncbi:hypothetical protein C8R34_12517 [Nitrosomonas sp. Nm84]|nr:hypothetical protein C8R34_12517 [Nitrosomonas sp. Nm84]
MLINKVLVLSLFFICSLNLTVYAQEIPSPQQALQNFNISPAQIKQLEQGKIVSYEVNEASKKELGIGLAMLIPVALTKIADYIKLGNLTYTESGLIASGPLSENADLRSFEQFGFSNEQLGEAKSFLNAKPGDSFNLSKHEFERLKSFKIDLQGADNKTLLKAANEIYREFLLQRFIAYRKRGLAGIAAYDRQRSSTDPGAELRIAAINSKALAQYFPELQQAWLNYPTTLPPKINEQFLWLNRHVEGRPTAILIHRLIAISEKGGIVLSRQFYVGHSYNSSHIAMSGLPYKNGTLVFYSIRSSTDQVDGMGSSLKHSIGREQMRKEMIKRLQRINKDLKLKVAPIASEN